ncbi:MAG: hypothetical protein EOT04_01005 [Candidatus Chaera renei]|uniref:ATP-cone domain-containing protein n=1 Tax=Candidatus Chaera renei TaxID=2506947 RepID=A0A4Q0AJP7_9BACT|nr:MAG: hypothetical protein EOT04_01005 [Candidatus Chaera renei]
MVDTMLVKRGGGLEAYDPAKLRSSLAAACKSVRAPEGEAETSAALAVARVERWLMGRPEVTTADIRRKAAEALVVYNPEAAYIYQQHKNIS